MSNVFNTASEAVADNSLDWINDTDIRVMLLQGAGTPARANATVAAVLANSNVDEVDATNYARLTMSGKAIIQSGDDTLFDAASALFEALGGATNNTVTGVLVYQGTLDSADDATNVPICYAELAAAFSTNGGDLTINWDSAFKVFRLRHPS